jgi:hypothetical protein
VANRSQVGLFQPNFPSCRRKSLWPNTRSPDFSTTLTVEKILPPLVDAFLFQFDSLPGRQDHVQQPDL